jgi:phosphoribosylanthranilate isomerase
MSLWIKICGNTSLEDAQLATEAGANALGFVFAPSPRRVTQQQAAAIVPQLSPAVEKFGVFVDASFAEITSVVENCSLTGVQLHFNAPRDLPMKLRGRIGPELRILRVVHFDGAGVSAAFGADYESDVDAILLDSRVGETVGGTGMPFDWAAAAATLAQNPRAHGRRFIAAGGLTPNNVARAIAALRPWGVDVVSGVESALGRKDPAKIRAFIANARAAASA